MKIDVALLPSQLEKHKLAGKAVVVIDVLRATSTIATALANGCREVIPVLEPDDAHAAARNLPTGSFLLGGERRGLKIPGFDLGNSPLEYRPEVVQGKTVILSTTNGTRAAILSREAEMVVFGSLLNAGAVASYCRKRCSDLVLACAGRAGEFSFEDTICAGMITSLLGAQNDLEQSDAALAARYLYERYEGRLGQALGESHHGRYLVKIGLGDDLAACAAANSIQLAPILRNGKIVAAEEW
ncbi:MAG: 2-phosphosulfolactate phosphatase [Syntrophothermus sp.]